MSTFYYIAHSSLYFPFLPFSSPPFPSPPFPSLPFPSLPFTCPSLPFLLPFPLNSLPPPFASPFPSLPFPLFPSIILYSISFPNFHPHSLPHSQNPSFSLFTTFPSLISFPLHIFLPTHICRRLEYRGIYLGKYSSSEGK